MRKSSVVVLFVLLIAFSAMLMAANTLLGPMERDLRVGKELAAALTVRRLIEPDSKVFTRSSRGGANEIRLNRDKDTSGVVVEVEPTREVLTKRGGLRAMALAIATEVQQLVSATRLDWLELAIIVGGDETFRVLMSLDGRGRWSTPEPALPEQYAPPKSPARTSSAAPAKAPVEAPAEGAPSGK